MSAVTLVGRCPIFGQDERAHHHPHPPSAQEPFISGPLMEEVATNKVHYKTRLSLNWDGERDCLGMFIQEEEGGA